MGAQDFFMEGGAFQALRLQVALYPPRFLFVLHGLMVRLPH